MKANFQLGQGVSSLLTVILISLVACNPGDNSANDTGPKRPHMWVDDSTSDADENHFTGYVTLLNTALGAGQHETDSIYYTLAEFKGMIDTFSKMPNIKYIDVCPAVNPSTNKLTVLYVPEDGNCTAIGYFVLPENRPTFPEKGDTLSPTDFHNWQDQYIKTVVQVLNPQLDSSDLGNYVDGDTSTQLLNTLHSAHYFTDFVELDTEISIQGTKLSGVEAFFSAKGTRPKGKSLGFSNRLYAMLEFTQDAGGKHQKFRIDTTNRPYQKPVLPPPTGCFLVETLKKKAKPKVDSNLLGGNNNGQLCPPTCNP